MNMTKRKTRTPIKCPGREKGLYNRVGAYPAPGDVHDEESILVHGRQVELLQAWAPLARLG